MVVLTNIVAAEEHEIEAIGESLHPVEEWSGFEMRNVDTAKITTLHCLLTGELFDDAVIQYEPVYVSPVEGAVVLRLADEVLERLLDLDEESLAQVAAELSATEDFESENWAEEEVVIMLAELCELAQRADSEGQGLFVWLHPLRA
ncbi:MAG: hypothetical protein ACYDCF_03930 [Burkholderiales bacterium]